jgi:hypothetical protein
MLPITSYQWFDHRGRLTTVYDECNIPDKSPYITKTLEDLNKTTCVITYQIPNTDIFDVLVISDDDGETKNKINFMSLAMLRLANKKGR